MKKTILMIDDDKMNLMFAKKMLGIRYDVTCVSSGLEALAYLRREALRQAQPPHL